MSNLKEVIVAKLPETLEPRVAYHLDNGDRTHTRYVTDDNGVLSKPTQITLVAGDNITIDNTDPLKPVVNAVAAEEISVTGVSPIEVSRENNVYQVSINSKGIVGNSGILVDSTHEDNHIISIDPAFIGEGLEIGIDADGNNVLKVTESVATVPTFNVTDVVENGGNYEFTVNYSAPDVEFTRTVRIPVNRYELPAHLQNITPEMVEALKNISGNIGKWQN